MQNGINGIVAGAYACNRRDCFGYGTQTEAGWQLAEDVDT